MKNLRILAIAFDAHIQAYELPQFRGAIARKVGIEHEWFHNHDNQNSGFHNRYPLIQYKLDACNGQLRPLLLCLDEGIEEAHHFFSQPDWSLQIGRAEHNLKIARLQVHQCRLHVWDKMFRYRLHKWQALNPDNYEKYMALRDDADRRAFLLKLLRAQLHSFAEGVGWNLPDDVLLRLASPAREEWLQYKHRQKIKVFTLDFETNLSLPDLVGIGKGASRGLGVVRSLQSVQN